MRAQDKGSSPKERTPGSRPAVRAGRPPGPAATVLDLQRLAGNAAVSRAVDAERHQHSAGCGHGEQPDVQRSSLVHQVLNSPGRALDTPLAGEMSARFGGVDFSSVRVHTDAVAQRSAAEIGASAYTSREHVVWNGRDKHTLAHELTHVVQQRQGPVSGADNGAGLRVSDPGDSFERAAEANAHRVMSGSAPVQRAVEQDAPGGEHGGHDHVSPDAAHTGGTDASVQRRVETPARVGFEFQQLKSKVDVKGGSDSESGSDDGLFATEETKSASESEPEVYEIKAEHYGKGSGLWYVVKDGQNLEFVTRPFKSMDELTKVMNEIWRVAKSIHQATRAEQAEDPRARPQFELPGDTYVTVHIADDSGQPQVNPDVPLDSLPGLYQHAAGDEQHLQDFYGADQAFWKAKDTKEEMQENAAVAANVLALDADVLARTFRMEDTSGEKLGSVRGLLQVLTAAAVHQAFFPSALPKDQPVLLKTHMGRLWRDLVADDVIGSDVSPNDVVALMCGLHGDLVEKAGVCKGIVRKVMQGVDPVWAGPLDSVDIGAPTQAGGPETADRKQVLVELRRVPVLPVDEWRSFAATAFSHFITDDADRYHQTL
ncbi:DUF4157 domain-containing protein [Streptomyces sp. BK239]|uniref:eCIS core domain-containing protein n=1 Tax=Streptomyces sp. BK239 TaxID=2512155 RepID=UPI0010E68499|nr:uncharacterized protein DUF4157 [Streptomyces sp. BK239]